MSLDTRSSAEALAPSSPGANSGVRRLPVLNVAEMLKEQRTLTAVERFAELHDAGEVPHQAQYYKALLPTDLPKAGQQYAFEVDLDSCTGCKACVTGCHALNGLDDEEAWRTVGLLHGGTAKAPALQTVTTSCHHCVEPACMIGCPVNAYEKDPVTGIVKHLDDQCFGCQYCTFMCPYDAPKFSKERGIVRKCDMCSDRLEHGEAPGCVQACPNEAIAIRVVDVSEAVQTSEAHAFLPGAPAPEHTLPTTIYKTQRVLPHNMLPADFYSTKPEHSHSPLVFMLTFTQLSIGSFVMSHWVERFGGTAAGNALAQSTISAALAAIALLASMFHLGRPWLAWRAFINLKRSWFSREAVALGAYAGLALVYAMTSGLPELLAKPELNGVTSFAPILLTLAPLLSTLAPVIQVATSITGVLGVFFSVMVYVATQRAHWAGSRTGVKFFGTMLLLGSSTVLTVWTFTHPAEGESERRVVDSLLAVIGATCSIKLLYEAGLLMAIRNTLQTVEKRMAHLMLTDLRGPTLLRFLCGAIGGLLLPWLLGTDRIIDEAVPWVALVMCAVSCVGELSERYLFFRAAPASRMPGSLR